MLKYGTLSEAIDREIIDPLEQTYVVADAHAEFDIEAIAERVLGDYADGYACQVDPAEFWQIVEDHQLPSVCLA